MGNVVFALLESHRRCLPTTHAPGRLNRELHRSNRVAGPFSNEASLPRFTSAMAAEISRVGEGTDLPEPPESE